MKEDGQPPKQRGMAGLERFAIWNIYGYLDIQSGCLKNIFPHKHFLEMDLSN